MNPVVAFVRGILTYYFWIGVIAVVIILWALGNKRTGNKRR